MAKILNNGVVVIKSINTNVNKWLNENIKSSSNIGMIVILRWSLSGIPQLVYSYSKLSIKYPESIVILD